MTELQDTVAAAARLLDLMRDSDVRRIRLAVEDVRIDVERGQDQDPALETSPEQARSTGATRASGNGGSTAAHEAAAHEAAAQEGAAQEAGGVAPGVPVVAPLMGVFYQRPAPDQPPFVEVGQHVRAGEQVAIVEAMKMMNPVLADREGVVLRVNVADGEVVEFEQSLLELRPVGSG